jgi:hypothetical protein
MQWVVHMGLTRDQAQTNGHRLTLWLHVQLPATTAVRGMVTGSVHDKSALAWGIIHDLKLSTQLLCTQAACLP